MKHSTGLWNFAGAVDRQAACGQVGTVRSADLRGGRIASSRQSNLRAGERPATFDGVMNIMHGRLPRTRIPVLGLASRSRRVVSGQPCDLRTR
jgi:hypothetical protein